MPYLQSDHQAVVIEIGLPENKKKKFPTPYWKMNLKNLKEEELQENIINIINKYKTKKNKNTTESWEMLKKQIQDLSKKYAKKAAEERRKYKSFISNALTSIASTIEEEGEETKERYLNLQQQARNIYDEEIKGAKIRTKNIQEINEETASLYHINQEKTNAKEKNITKIIIEDITYNNPEEIQKQIDQYYTKLYTLIKPNNPKKDFNSAIKPKINRKTKKELVKPIEEVEIQRAIKETKENKSPGIDGIPNEFYKTFTQHLTPILLETFNHILFNKQMSTTQKTGAITLIHKSGPKENLNNWRPVSLLCSDYKILARILASRMKPTLNKIINPNQTGGIPRRSIADNLTTIRNFIIDTTDTEGKAIVSVDFEKAFDKVDRQQIYTAMKKLGFPKSYINYIKILMEDVKSKIITNGKTGKSITMTRGIKQGCPLAGFLYIIYIESLQLEIQRRITASRIGSEQIQTGGFIDDITIFISDETDLKEVEKILEEFQETTNSKINKNKTTIMGLGSWTGRKKWPLTWIKTTPSTKILGIEHFPTTQEITEKLEKKTTKIIKILLTQTNQRILTLQQRVQYFNLHVIPIICHGATIYPIRNNTTKEINKLAYAFVWKGKWEKLTKEECYLPAEEGGLGLIEASAKASSVNLNSIRKNLFSKSKQMEYLLGYEAKFIKSPEPGPKKETTPLFFKQILKKAKKMKQNNPDLTWTEINAKKIYELLVKVTKPKIFNNNPTNNYQLTLRNINKINHLPETKEFLFQFMHNILPTKVRLKRCRANIETDCAHCEDTPEDREHILRCPSSKAAITWMMNQIAKITDSEALNNLTVQQILYLDFNINDKKENTKVAWITAHFCLTLLPTCSLLN